MDETRREEKQTGKMKRGEEEQVEERKERSAGRRSQVQDIVMHRAKRERRCTVQGLIDSGPLLPTLDIQVPPRLYKMTRIDLERQISDEQVRQRMVRQE